MGRGGSKKCKPIPAPPRGAGLKSRLIPAPSSLRGGENPHGAKRGGAGQAGQGKIAIPNIAQNKVKYKETTTFLVANHRGLCTSGKEKHRPIPNYIADSTTTIH